MPHSVSLLSPSPFFYPARAAQENQAEFDHALVHLFARERVKLRREQIEKSRRSHRSFDFVAIPGARFSPFSSVDFLGGIGKPDT
jgi:hypothetical protein